MNEHSTAIDWADYTNKRKFESEQTRVSIKANTQKIKNCNTFD